MHPHVDLQHASVFQPAEKAARLLRQQGHDGRLLAGGAAAGELLGLQVPDLHELRRPRGSEQTGVLVPPTDHRRRDLAALRLVLREYRERHERRHDPRLSDVPNKYGPFPGPFHQQRGLRGVDPLERRRARAQLRVDRRHRLILAVIEQRNRLPHPHLHETPSLHPPKPR